MREITPPQTNTLIYIHNFIVLNGYSPSIADIADEYLVCNNASAEVVQALVKKGYVTKRDRIARSIVLTSKADVFLETL